MTLAHTIRNAMKADPRSMYRIALDSGVALAVLSRFMRGQRDITLDTADRLCRALRLKLRPGGRKGR